MSEYSGNIRDLPVVTGGHFIENSTKKIVFGPDGRFWNDYVMRLFTLEPEAESSVHSHPWPHWFLCIQGEGYFLIDKERVPLEFGTWVPCAIGNNTQKASCTAAFAGIPGAPDHAGIAVPVPAPFRGACQITLPRSPMPFQSHPG